MDDLDVVDLHEVYCTGLMETKQSWAQLQDDGYMIWAPDQKPKAASTLIWWDTETCPAPSSSSSRADAAADHLVQVLSLQSHARVTCIAYGTGAVPDPLLLALKAHAIAVHRRNLPTCTLPGAGTSLGMKSMIVDILFWALNNPPPAQVRIISATTEANFSKLIRGLHKRCYRLFLTSSFYHSPNLWHLTPKPDQLADVEQSRASMDDVRGWLEWFVAQEESLHGMNISMMPKHLDRLGRKLDLRHLNYSSLSRLLLESFGDLVRLKYPTRDCTFMFPVSLSRAAEKKMVADFCELLAHLLPRRESESPMSTVKAAFRARFGYDLDHEGAGFAKLSQFLASVPELVRVRPCSSQAGKELVICRPSVYFVKQQTSRISSREAGLLNLHSVQVSDADLVQEMVCQRTGQLFSLETMPFPK